MWAGQQNVQAGDRIVGIAYDLATTAAAISDACAEFPTAHAAEDVRPALGIRSVAVGLLRRRLWLVHHGTPVRHRADDLRGAAGFVADLLRRLATPRADGEMTVSCRAFARGGRAVLVRVRDDQDVDERPLHKRGIEQVPALSAVVNPAARTVVQPDRTYALVGAVVEHTILGRTGALDDARRHLLALAVGDRVTWAWAIDELGDRIVVTADVGAAIRRLLA